jgi:hypothetical protein
LAAFDAAGGLTSFLAVAGFASFVGAPGFISVFEVAIADGFVRFNVMCDFENERQCTFLKALAEKLKA